MIKHALVLFYSLFLAVGPVAAQVQEAAAGGKAGPGVTAMATGPGDNAILGLPVASPGLGGPLSGGGRGDHHGLQLDSRDAGPVCRAWPGRPGP